MDKISALIQQKQQIFRTQDLKTIWQISNPKTLHQTIYRFKKKKILFSIQKGFYSIVPIDQLDPTEIGFRAINSFCYLSTESVLAKHGIINQSPSKTTFISNKSLNFIINDNYYLVRQLKTISLNNPIGIGQNDQGIFTANIERAVADMLYFQPNYHFDADSLIDWKTVKNYQSELNYL